MPEPNKIPHGLRNSDAETSQCCGNCAYFETVQEQASYGKCVNFDHSVLPTWVCNSFTAPEATE